MSQKELIRIAVLTRVASGTLTLTEASPLLGLSYRQAKRVYRRYRTDGTEGLVHGNVGRASNHARDAGEREHVVELVRAHYSGGAQRGPGQRFGPTLVAEHLREEHGIGVPCSTLRDWMSSAGLWSRVRRSKPRTVRRERRAHFGELVQLDGSFHDWFEGRGPRAGRRSCVMNLVDDATGITQLRFGDQETTWAAAGALQAWIETYGVPRALYTDWKNVYKREPTRQEQVLGEEGHTQFGRICAKLGIKIIAAGTPQAKGRVERNHGTQQDRLIKKMRLLEISNDDAANAYVRAVYLPQHNTRFTVSAASPVDYHLPRDAQLEDRDVFCLEHTRTVSNDFVVQFEKRGLQLDRGARGRVPAGSKVLVRETADGQLRVVHVGRTGAERECHWTPAVAQARRARSESARPMSVPASTSHCKPAPDHPWRQHPFVVGRGVHRPPLVASAPAALQPDTPSWGMENYKT